MTTSKRVHCLLPVSGAVDDEPNVLERAVATSSPRGFIVDKKYQLAGALICGLCWLEQSSDHQRYWGKPKSTSWWYFPPEEMFHKCQIILYRFYKDLADKPQTRLSGLRTRAAPRSDKIATSTYDLTGQGSVKSTYPYRVRSLVNLPFTRTRHRTWYLQVFVSL